LLKEKVNLSISTTTPLQSQPTLGSHPPVANLLAQLEISVVRIQFKVLLQLASLKINAQT
jgi:hypothetical protein